MKIALILGGHGLVGQALVRQLKTNNFLVNIAGLDPGDKKENQLQLDIFNEQMFREILISIKPNLIVNCVNIATICSQTADGMTKLTGFYINLYQALKNLGKSMHYIQIGTTGSGGLGLDIPFTHGQDLKDLPIIRKAAFAGVSTSMLTLLSRSFKDNVTISEIKPGLAIFDPIIKIREEKEFLLTTLDGGESGHYTYNELALLTSFMGFTDTNAIAEKAMSVVRRRRVLQRSVKYDVMNSLNETIISEEASDRVLKDRLLSEMKKLTSSRNVITTGNLGPPSTARDLLLGYFLLTNQTMSRSEFDDQFRADPRISATFQYLLKNNESLAKYLVTACSYEALRHLTTYQRDQNHPWELVRDRLRSAT